jgi:hypothetical protein
MTPKRAIDRFLESTRGDIHLGAAEIDLSTPERLSATLELDLNAAKGSAARWNWVILLTLGGLAALTIASDGTAKLAGVLGAGGFGALLVQVSRRKFAVDLLISLLKDASNNEQRRKLVEVFRGRF